MPRLIGPPAVDVTLRRSPRARRFSLRVSRPDGRVTLTMPLRAREADAMAFLSEQESWLRRILAQLPQGASVAPGVILPFEGRPLRLLSVAGRVCRVTDDALLVPGEPHQMGVHLAAFLKTRARDRIAAAADYYAARLGRGYRSLTLRDTRSRWGSCTSDGRLMFSWRLIMAPPEVLDYVAAHEVAHLVEMNHSADFWALVEQLYPGHQGPRHWLSHQGQVLQAYRFGA